MLYLGDQLLYQMKVGGGDELEEEQEGYTTLSCDIYIIFLSLPKGE